MKRIVVAVLLAVAALPSIAQQSEVINVEVTNLDVVVTDSKGKRVTGLTRADFEVLEDGKKQEITNLSEASRTGSATTDTIQPAPRHILLVVDNGTIALSARRKVFDATRATLERLLIGPSDRLAVATISRSVKQRLVWTPDKAEILKTLALIEKDAILPNPNLAEFERTLDAIRDGADQSAATQPVTDQNGNQIPGSYTGSSNSGMSNSRSLPPIDFSQVIAAGRNYAASATNETKQTISSLNAALSAFAGVQGGRKLIILVGGGLPLNAADAIFQRIESVREQAELTGHKGFKGARSASTYSQTAGYDVTPLLDSLVSAAKLKGVAVYAVNPELTGRQSGSVGSRGVADSVAEFAVIKGVLDGYNRLASATGGTAMIGRPADQVITEIVNDLESYYSLGYRTSAKLSPKTQIVVKVKKGLTARTTLSSGAISRDWEVSDQVVANHLLEPANPLSISVVMDPAIVDGDKKTIPIKIMIPVNSLKLVQDGGEYAASFAVFISMGDEGGNGSEPSRQEQSFRWPENAVEQVKGKTIGFAVNLEVGTGRDRVSVGVLDQYSGAAGYTRAMLE